MSDFGKILKQLREEKGFTQTELAEKLSTPEQNVSPQNVSYWEKGRQPPFEILNRIADTFEVTVDYLTNRVPYRTFREELNHRTVQNEFGASKSGKARVWNDPKWNKNLITLMQFLYGNLENAYLFDEKILFSLYYNLQHLCNFYSEWVSSILAIEKQSNNPRTLEDFFLDVVKDSETVENPPGEYHVSDGYEITNFFNKPNKQAEEEKQKLIDNLDKINTILKFKAVDSKYPNLSEQLKEFRKTTIQCSQRKMITDK